MATLVSHIVDLVTAIRTKLNLMTPRLLPTGGVYGQILYKSGPADGASGWTTPPAYTAATVTITTASIEWTQTLTDANLVGTENLFAWLVPTTDADENCPEMTDLVTITATAAAGSVTITLTFSELTSGPIKVAYKAQ